MTETTPDDALKRVGRAVADRRLEVGFEFQRELAEAAGVALGTAALLERGKTFPRPGNRALLEDALQWPRGTLEALLRNEPLPPDKALPAEVAPTSPPAAPAATATNRKQVLAIAEGVAAVAATCTAVLLTYSADPQAQTALRELDTQLLNLESLIAASLPHAGELFGETMSALTALHHHRDAIRNANVHAPSLVDKRRTTA